MIAAAPEPTSMTLRTLLATIADVPFTLHAGPDVEVAGVTADSRAVRPGDVFVALPGTRTDGARFIADACARGAVAVVAAPDAVTPAGVARVDTADPARLLAHLASAFHGDPSSKLTMVGITGTNGKTTTTYLLEAIWRGAGLRPGVIGTISYRFEDEVIPAPLTTPPAAELFALLARMRDRGATHVAMEVSSHALAQGRAEGVAWDAAIFTNLGRDHLDYHADEDAYFEAKAALFRALDASPKPARVAIVNADDARGRVLAARVASRVVTFGRGADVHADDAAMTLDGTTATLVFAATGERVPIRTRLIGSGHLANVLAAAATAHALGVPAVTIAAAVAAFPGVPGRLEPVPSDRGFTVLVDYAHTPDALEGILDSLRAIAPGRVICLFGCGGDRDRGKRPLMAAAVGARAQLVVLTSDNPRTEDPLAIIADAEPALAASGLPRVADLATVERGYVVVPDRAAAIAAAMGAAHAGDCVVIAGKGHEDYQILGTVKVPFDDRTIARDLLAQRAGR